MFLLAGYASDLPYGVRPLEDALCRSWIKSLELIIFSLINDEVERHSPQAGYHSQTNHLVGKDWPPKGSCGLGPLADPADVTDKRGGSPPGEVVGPPFMQT